MRSLSGFSLFLAVAITTAAAQTPPRITRIEFTPAPETEGGGIVIALLGSGQCSYTLDYGDGKTERRNATLPDRVQHAFAADQEYTIVATPDAPCEGTARARLDIRAITRGIWRVTIEPGPAANTPEVIATIDGRGSCVVSVDFGDGTTQKLEGTLPAKINHTYEKPGSYDVRAVAQAPCRGEVQLKLDVR
jgi:hypothetical protein